MSAAREQPTVERLAYLLALWRFGGDEKNPGVRIQAENGAKDFHDQARFLITHLDQGEPSDGR